MTVALVMALLGILVLARAYTRAMQRADRAEQRLEEVMHEGRLKGWELGMAERFDE